MGALAILLWSFLLKPKRVPYPACANYPEPGAVPPMPPNDLPEPLGLQRVTLTDRARF